MGFFKLGQTFMQEENWKEAEEQHRKSVKKGDQKILKGLASSWYYEKQKGIKYENLHYLFQKAHWREDMEADARRWVKVIESKQAREKLIDLAEAAEAELADDSIYQLIYNRASRYFIIVGHLSILYSLPADLK